MNAKHGGLCAITVLCLCLPCFASAAPADEVRTLLEQGNSAQAYALGKREPQELGKPDFDFYFGIAAIDAGHAGEGVLALERYILQFPDNDRARLELARGYFVLGELVRAREEFNAVSKKNPPADVQATIDRFMDSIRAQETRYTTSATGYVDLGGGYDSNVNLGVSNGLIAVPLFGNLQFQLAQTGVKGGSSFLLLGAGGQISHPVAPGVAVLGGGNFEAKLNATDFGKNFDQTNYGGYGGVSYLKDKDLYRATASLARLDVHNSAFRDVGALGGEWHHQFDEFNTGSLLLQYARLEYPQSKVRNTNFYGAGAGWRRAFVGRLQPVVEGQVFLAQEQNDARPGPRLNFLSRNLYTVRGGVALTPAPKWGASAGLLYTKSRFRDTDPFFLRTRDDDYYGIDAGISYRLNKKLTLRADYLHSENRSNIDLYKYTRDMITLRARYEF